MACTVLRKSGILWLCTRCLGATSPRICFLGLGCHEIPILSAYPTSIVSQYSNDAKAVINHEELTKQIAKALSKIASVMPRTDLALVLYPTEKMQDAVARLYAHIMKFFQKAIRWYRKGRLSHAIGSIFSPWELSWKESLKEIDLQSREIDKLSGSASNAEQRDIHLEVTAHGTQLAAQGTQLATHGTQLAEIIALIKLQNVQIEILVNSASGE